MITREQVPTVLDHQVLDARGKKIGEAGDVYLDDVTGEPEWAIVRMGRVRHRESFVPLRGARLVRDHLEVPYERSTVKDSPDVGIERGGHLSGSQEEELYRYYGIDWRE